MRFLTLLLIAGILTPSQSQATSFIARPFEEVVKEAPMIVKGIVGETYADWAPAADGQKRIFTFTNLDVKETLKGNHKSEILMRQLGGIKDGQGMVLSGTATFRQGQEVVVMLGDATPDGSHEVWGLMMGKFDIIKNEAGEESISGPGISDDSGGIVDDDHGDNHEHNKEGDVPKRSLKNLRELIQSQASGENNSEKEKDSAKAAQNSKPTRETVSLNDIKKGNGKSQTPAGESTERLQPQGGATGFQVLSVVAILGAILIFVIRRFG